MSSFKVIPVLELSSGLAVDIWSGVVDDDADGKIRAEGVHQEEGEHVEEKLNDDVDTDAQNLQAQILAARV